MVGETWTSVNAIFMVLYASLFAFCDRRMDGYVQISAEEPCCRNAFNKVKQSTHPVQLVERRRAKKRNKKSISQVTLRSRRRPLRHHPCPLRPYKHLLSRRIPQFLQPFTVHVPQHDVVAVSSTSEYWPAALALWAVHAAGTAMLR